MYRGHVKLGYIFRYRATQKILLLNSSSDDI